MIDNTPEIFKTSLLFGAKMSVFYTYAMAFFILFLKFVYWLITGEVDINLDSLGRYTMYWILGCLAYHYVLTVIYSVKVFNDRIEGYSQEGKNNKLCWEDIASVEMQKIFWPCKYIVLNGNDGETKLVVPYKGLRNYGNFIKAVKRYTKPSNPLHDFIDAY